MFKINKMTDYAVVCISFLSINKNKFINAQEISNSTGLSLFTVQKTLKVLRDSCIGQSKKRLPYRH